MERSLWQNAERSAPNLADLLERVLDKGVVIAGDIRINLLDIELLTVKLRLLVMSVDKAKQLGIDWWEREPSLSGAASPALLAENEQHQDEARRPVRQLQYARQQLPDLQDHPARHQV